MQQKIQGELQETNRAEKKKKEKKKKKIKLGIST